MTTPQDPDAERQRIMRQRNYMLAGLLLAMAGLFYVITIVRIQG